MLQKVIQLSTMPDIEEYATIEQAEADERVPYGAYWIRRLAQEGKIQAIKVGPENRGQWLVYMPSLLDYIDRMEDLGTKKHGPKG